MAHVSHGEGNGGGKSMLSNKRKYEKIETDRSFKAFLASTSTRVCPFQVPGDDGKILVMSLGAVVSDLEGYHDEEYIFPIGYQIVRVLPSIEDPGRDSDYVLEIRYGGFGNGPVFVMKEARSNVEYSNSDPDALWQEVLAKIEDDLGKPVHNMDGFAVFGLSRNSIRTQIKSLPGAEMCSTNEEEESPPAKIQSTSVESFGRPGRAKPMLGAVSAKQMREKERQALAEVKERLKQERADLRQQEKEQFERLKEQERLEKERIKEQAKEQQRTERERLRAEQELRRDLREKAREEERRQREALRLAEKISSRNFLVDDLELITMRKEVTNLKSQHASTGAEVKSEEQSEESSEERILIRADKFDCGLDEALLPLLLQVYEFVSFFAELLWVETAPNNFTDFCKILSQPDCAFFHGLHVALVEKLYVELQSENTFLGRPLNAVTWPELLRQYLAMLQQEHTLEYRANLAREMRLQEFCSALENTNYEDLPLQMRLEILVSNADLMLETTVARTFVDTRVELSTQLHQEMKNEVSNLVREMKDAKAEVDRVESERYEAERESNRRISEVEHAQETQSKPVSESEPSGDLRLQQTSFNHSKDDVASHHPDRPAVDTQASTNLREPIAQVDGANSDFNSRVQSSVILFTSIPQVDGYGDDEDDYSSDNDDEDGSVARANPPNGANDEDQHEDDDTEMRIDDGTPDSAQRQDHRGSCGGSRSPSPNRTHSDVSGSGSHATNQPSTFGRNMISSPLPKPMPKKSAAKPRSRKVNTGGNRSLSKPMEQLVVTQGAPNQPVEWIQCDSCQGWRFFQPGLPPDQVSDEWECSVAGKVCKMLTAEETFMLAWNEVMEDEGAVYKFIIEDTEFTVYELYWSVQVNGGYEKIKKWKKVADDMMMRKRNHTTNEEGSKGVNYTGVKNQFLGWRLDKLECILDLDTLPDAYKQDAIRKRKRMEIYASNGSWRARRSADVSKDAYRTSEGGDGGDYAGEGEGGMEDCHSAGNNADEGAAQSYALQLGEAPEGTSRSPCQVIVIEQNLSEDDRLKIMMSQSASVIRGPRNEEAAIKRKVDMVFLQKMDEASYRSEALGQDRFYNTYWLVGKDFSKLWVESFGGVYGEPDGEQGKWGVLTTIQQVDELIEVMDCYGVREYSLIENLRLRRDQFAAAMSPEGVQDDGYTTIKVPDAADTGVEGEDSGDGDSNKAAQTKRPLQLRYSDWVSVSQKYLELTQPVDNVATRPVFSQSLYGISTSKELAAGREYFGILDSHRSAKAGDLKISAAMCKLKGDLLLVEMAMKQESVMECFCDQRDGWLSSVKMAESPAEIYQVLQLLIASVKKLWLQPWYKNTQMAMLLREAKGKQLDHTVDPAEDEEEQMQEEQEQEDVVEDKPLMTCAAVGLSLYGFDQAILFDGERDEEPDDVEEQEPRASVAFPTYPYPDLHSSTDWRPQYYLPE